jgi:hypothetical protein
LLLNEETVELPDVQNVTVGYLEGLATHLDGYILEEVTPDTVELENNHNEQPHDLHCLLGWSSKRGWNGNVARDGGVRIV